MTTEMMPGRRALVTVGSMASFRSLLDEVLSDEFLRTLANHGFGDVEVQCGPDYAWFCARANQIKTFHGIEITPFATSDNMKEKMLWCRGERTWTWQQVGIIISHAGSGTILEANRYQVPIIVVPNPTLMNNHQEELAVECDRQNWAVQGKLGRLSAAIDEMDARIAKGARHLTAPLGRPTPPLRPAEGSVDLFHSVLLTCYTPEERKKYEHAAALRKVEEESRRELRAADGEPGSPSSISPAQAEPEAQEHDKEVRAKLEID